MNRRTIGWATLTAYIATVFAANWSIEVYGVVPVGFGLMAPAAVYVVGLAFTLRDIVQEVMGTRVVIGAIIAGAGLSVAVSPQLALASGTAFLVSEFADLAVYTPLRNKGLIRALVASNVVGLVVDSVLFLSLAFGSMEFLAGQIVGKGWMTVLAVALLIPARRRLVTV